MPQRKVTRVLVMLQYEAGNPDNGEIFDLTALVEEMRQRGGASSCYSARIGLDVRAERAYTANGPAAEMFVHWNGDVSGGEWVHGAEHPADVVNASLPDGERVQRFRRSISRAEKRIYKLKHDAMVAKLEQVAAVRHQHPIARVTSIVPVLSETASVHASGNQP